MKTKLQKDLERIDLLKACIKSLNEEITQYNKELEALDKEDKEEIEMLKDSVGACELEIEEYKEELEYLKK